MQKRAVELLLDERYLLKRIERKVRTFYRCPPVPALRGCWVLAEEEGLFVCLGLGRLYAVKRSCF